MGVDSLTAMELNNILRQDLSCSLPSILTFDFLGSLEPVNHFKFFLSQAADNSQSSPGNYHVDDQEDLFYQEISAEGFDEKLGKELLDSLSDEYFDKLIDGDMDKFEGDEF